MLISYTKLNVNIITAIITIVLFSVINYVGINISNAYGKIEQDVVQEQEIEEDKIDEDANLKTSENIVSAEEIEPLWQIEIPKINLVAPINSGTTKEVMDKYVGHFDETSSWDGNIRACGS